MNQTLSSDVMPTNRAAMPHAAADLPKHALVLLRHGEFLGCEIGRATASGFIATVRKSGSGEKDKLPHSHGNPHLLLPMDEGYWSEADGFDEKSSSQLFYTPAGTSHRDSMVRLGGRYLSISVDNFALENSELELRVPIALERPPAARIAHGIAVKILHGYLSELVLEEACLALIGELSDHTRKIGESPPRWLKYVIEMCNSRPQIWPKISDIADAIDVHPVHVTRVFRNHFGLPLSRYILSIKIERVAAALRAGKFSVAAIAAENGFSDQSHLCKSFKLLMGVTPSEYRALFK
jgi:AraC family transcriptional regulator